MLNNKQKINHVPKNLSARLLDCRARAVRKPLLSDGMMVDWQTKAPTKLEKSSASATMSFRVTSVILSVQIAIFFPCRQSGKKWGICWLLIRHQKSLGKFQTSWLQTGWASLLHLRNNFMFLSWEGQIAATNLSLWKLWWSFVQTQRHNVTSGTCLIRNLSAQSLLAEHNKTACKEKKYLHCL